MSIKKYRILNFSYVLAIFVLSSCVDNRGYVNDSVQKFLAEIVKDGMTFVQVQQNFTTLGLSLELFNNCSKAFEVSVTPCDLGYTSMIVFPAATIMKLKSDNDNGDVQVSLTYDASLVLKNHFYEIYFKDLHN